MDSRATDKDTVFMSMVPQIWTTENLYLSFINFRAFHSFSNVYHPPNKEYGWHWIKELH